MGFRFSRRGTFDSEDSDAIEVAVRWAVRRYGLTSDERRRICSCELCRDHHTRDGARREQLLERFLELRKSDLPLWGWNGYYSA